MTADCETNCLPWGLKKNGGVSWLWPLCRCVLERAAFRRNILAVRTSVSSPRTTEQNICNNYSAVTIPDFPVSHQKQKRLPVKTKRAATSRSDERSSVCNGIRTRTGKKTKNISSSLLSWLESEKCFCGKMKTRKEKKNVTVAIWIYNLTIN